MTEQLYSEIGTFTPDNLIAGNEVDVVFKGLTILAGQGVLAKGSVVGVITASGKGKLAAKASVDGSQVAKFVLSETVDTTSADVIVPVYAAALLNRSALIFAAGNTAADHEDSLRQYGIFLKDNIAY